MSDRVIALLLSLYVLIGVAVFGHSWSRQPWTERDREYGNQFAGSVISALGWPFYVSKELWEVKP